MTFLVFAVCFHYQTAFVHIMPTLLIQVFPSNRFILAPNRSTYSRVTFVVTVLLTGEPYVVAEIEEIVTSYLVPGTALETST